MIGRTLSHCEITAELGGAIGARGIGAQGNRCRPSTSGLGRNRLLREVSEPESHARHH